MKISENLNRIIMAAYAEANVRRHEFITPEHLLYASLFFDEGKEIILHCGGDPARLKGVLEKHLDVADTATPTPSRAVQSLGFQSVLERAAWHGASAQKETLDLGDILVSLLEEKESHASFFLQREGISRLVLLNYISHGISVLSEEEGSRKTDSGARRGEAVRGDQAEPNKFLRAYTTELTARAKAGDLDPLIGRDEILSRTIQVLCRRFKNNPVHVGEPGVGKTAITEGLAQLVAAGKVPRKLRDVKIYSLDMGSVLAGTRFRGDFEERMKRVLSELLKLEKLACPTCGSPR